MPVYRIQMPDGSVARIQADRPEDAVTHATSLVQKPGASQNKGNRSASDQTDYLRELQKQRALTAANPTQTTGALGKLESFGAGEVGPIAGELFGGLAAGGNAAVNLYRRATGQPQVSSRAIYEANRDATDEETARETNANPVSAGTGSVAGLLSAGGELAKGVGLLKDLPAVVKAGSAMKALPGATRTAQAIDAAKTLAAAKVSPKVLNYGGKVAKAVGVGAGTGGALGFANGSDLDERLQNATEGAELGGVTGGLFEGVAAPIAKPFIGAGQDLLRGIGAKLRPEVADGAVTAADQLAARKAVGSIAQQAGVTSDNLAERIAPYAGLDQVGAEALGSSGQNTLAAVARRSGTTGDNLRTAMRARQISQPQGIMEDFGTHLGVDPESAAGNVEAMVKAGQEKAGPAFRGYYDATQGGVTDPEVERLLATPMGQKLVKGIQARAKNLGRPAEALTYGRVEVPEAATGVDPMAATPEGVPAAVRRAPSAPPSRGLSFVDWLRRQGGLSGEGAGEMAAMDAGSVGARSRMNPQELDAIAEKAQEAGYFPPSPDGTRPTHVDVLDAIKEELAGRPRYAREPDLAAQARFEGANADEEAIYRGHTGGPEIGEDAYGNSGVNAPHYEPALQESLTGESLDRIRRRANAAVAREPSGAPVRSGPKGVKNEERATFAQQFSDALAGQPGAPSGAPGAELLRGALDTSSDYLGIGKAFKNFQGQLTRGSTGSFTKAWKALKPGAEQDAARGALAHDVIELWGRGQLKGGKFATPGIQAKLEMAFGKEGSRAFVQQMEKRAELAASGSRMAPFSGSPTMSLAEASQATNEMAPVAGTLGRIGGKVAKGKFGSALTDTIGSLANYTKTAGQTTGFRNELGRILSLPSDSPELAELLKEAENLTPTQQADFLARLGLGSDRATRLGTAGAVAAAQSKHD